MNPLFAAPYFRMASVWEMVKLVRLRGDDLVTLVDPEEQEAARVTPASVGSVWFREHVHGKAYCFGISPRLTFVGEKDPYPKDLMLSLFTSEGYSGFEPWNWLDWARPI